MQNFWPTVFFWVSFSIISSLIFRHLYFSKNAILLRKLRIAAAALIVGVFILLFFPWLPEAHGGPSGWGIILQGDAPMVILAGLLSFTLITLFIPHKPLLFKIGILAHFAATLFLFAIMINAFPGTVSLEFRDTAPIFAALILLANNVVLLLVWNQLQKNKFIIE